MHYETPNHLKALLAALALACSIAATATADTYAAKPMALEDKETIPEIDRELRTAVAARLERAARDLGVEIEPATVAYASSRKRTFAAARVSGDVTFGDLLAGKPMAVWFVATPSGSEPATGFYTAALSERGVAVLKNRQGQRVATGPANLTFGGPTGFCEFEQYDDDVCLSCEGPEVPAEFGGTWTYTFCFKFP